MTTKLTIRDIARLAGVSKSTVSRVLAQSMNVDPATSERVHRVMKEYSFAPSLHATALKGKNMLIGMIVPALSWELVAEIVVGIARVFDPTPYEIVLFTSDPNKGYKDALNRIISTHMTAGLLVVGFAPISEEMVQLHHQGMPVVLVNIVGWQVDLPRVGDDNFGGGLVAIRHLINLGHTRIAYIEGDPRVPCSATRYAGYRAALAEAGLEPHPELQFPGHFWVEDGTNAIEAIVKLPAAKRPTAIFASSDLSAYGALSAAEKYGIRIPQDIALVGYNDISPSSHTSPTLTTVRQPFLDMGHCAADLLISLLDAKRPFPEKWLTDAVHVEGSPNNNAQSTEKPLMLDLATRLIVRESCGAHFKNPKRPDAYPG